MNRSGAPNENSCLDVPRGSGDEPAILGQTLTTEICSPRERG